MTVFNSRVTQLLACGRQVGHYGQTLINKNKVFIIAELSANHNNDF